MDEQKFISAIRAVSKQKYENVSKDKLILYVVDFLNKNSIETTYENIIVVAFKLFPEIFSLINFKDYPDAKHVHDCLWHCTYKTKQWLLGDPKGTYKLTDKGKFYLNELNEIFSGKIATKKTKKSNKPKRREVYFIDKIKKSVAYNKFKKNINDIDKEQLRVAIFVTRETSKERVKKNIMKFKELAKVLNEKNTIDFLCFVEDKLLNEYD